MAVTRAPNYLMTSSTSTETTKIVSSPYSASKHHLPTRQLEEQQHQSNNKTHPHSSSPSKSSPKRGLSLPVVSPPSNKRLNGTANGTSRQQESKLLEYTSLIRFCSFIQFTLLMAHGVFLIFHKEVLLGLGFLGLSIFILSIGLWVKNASRPFTSMTTQSSIDHLYSAVTTQFAISICTSVLSSISVVLWSSSLIIASIYSIDNITLAENPDDEYLMHLTELIQLSIPFATINLMLTSFELVLSIVSVVAAFKCRQMIQQLCFTRHASSIVMMGGSGQGGSPDSIISVDKLTVSSSNNNNNNNNNNNHNHKDFHSLNTAASSFSSSSSSGNNNLPLPSPRSPDSVRDVHTGHRYDELLYDETTPSPSEHGFVHI